jgi:hypothetical protein
LIDRALPSPDRDSNFSAQVPLSPPLALVASTRRKVKYLPVIPLGKCLEKKEDNAMAGSDNDQSMPKQSPQSWVTQEQLKSELRELRSELNEINAAIAPLTQTMQELMARQNVSTSIYQPYSVQLQRPASLEPPKPDPNNRLIKGNPFEERIRAHSDRDKPDFKAKDLGHFDPKDNGPLVEVKDKVQVYHDVFSFTNRLLVVVTLAYLVRPHCTSVLPFINDLGFAR